MDEKTAGMNLYQKLSKIRQLTEVIGKNKKGYGYSYISIDEILARVSAGMKKYGVSLIPELDQESVEIEPYQYTKTKSTGKGEFYEEKINEFTAKASIHYVWVNNDDPDDRIDVPWYISASQGDPSQVLGSALTYGLRYFLMQFFQIASPEDDPDSWRSKQREAEEEEDRVLAQKIIEEVHSLVSEHLKASPDDKEKIVALTKKYVKDGNKASANYFVVKNPIVASNLLGALKEEILKEKE